VAWDTRDGERLVDGSLHYPLGHTETSTVAVVGHTGCGAVEAAYRCVVDGVESDPEPVRERVERTVPVLKEDLEAVVGDASDEDEAVNALVEHNVHEQVDFLLGDDYVPDEVGIYSFVYDIHGAYGEVRGRTCLVDTKGERDLDAVRARLPDGYERFAGFLLDG